MLCTKSFTLIDQRLLYALKKVPKLSSLV